MTTLSILRHALKLNATVITEYLFDLACLRQEAKAWRQAAETAYFVDTWEDIRKLRTKLGKAADMQKRIKVEIAAIFRNERIVRKYVKVFGKTPNVQLTTSHEQEAMLDRLLLDREAEAALDSVNISQQIA
jgi:hypothetical protein